jgi:ABC-type phosphate transport system substrate-binding protein
MAAAVALAAASTPAHAAVTGLYGGGSTLAEKVYRDLFNSYGSTSSGELCAKMPTVCPTSHYNADVELLYVGVGSGNAIKALDGYNPALFVSGGKTPDNPPTPSTTDLGVFYGTGVGNAWVPGSGVGPNYPKVTFAGSDNILSATDVTAIAANGFGPAIQIPGIVAAIAVPFHPTATWTPKGVQPTGGSSKVQLSLNTLCGIFNGDITNWNDAAIKKDNKNVVLGSGTIYVQYRSDSSGTTFIFTNALLNQCGTTTHPSAKTTHQIPDQWVTDNGSGVTTNGSAPFYTSGTSFFINVNSHGHLPANFIQGPSGAAGGVSGSGGIKTAINNIVGSIGYVSPDFVQPVDPAGPQAANLQTYLTFSNGGTPIYKAPTAANATPIMSTAKPPVFTMVAGSVPAANPLNWGAVSPTPTAPGAYPIGGFSFIDLYSCYKTQADVDALVGTVAGNLGYFRWYYGTDAQNDGVPGDILAQDGFAPVPTAWKAAINNLLVNKDYGIGIPKVGKKAGTRACKAVTNGA